MADSRERPWLKAYDTWVGADLEVPDTTLADRMRQIEERFGNKSALRFMGIRISYQQLMSQVRRFAQALRDMGCQRGDVVGVGLPNTPQFLVAHLGAILAGCAPSGVSPLLTPAELAYQLQDCEAKVFVTQPDIFEQRLLPVITQLEDLEAVIATEPLDCLPWYRRVPGWAWGRLSGKGRLRQLATIDVLSYAQLLARYPDHDPLVAITPADLCQVQYTGGTTGLPKGAALTHRNLVANSLQVVGWMRIQAGGEVLLSGFPLFHQAGIAMAMVALWTGGTLVLVSNLEDDEGFCKEIARNQPSILATVPSHYMRLLEVRAFQQLDFLPLRLAITGAAPMPLQVGRELEQAIGEGKLVEIYGMTEASPMITANPYKGRKKLGSVGLPLPGTWVKLADLEKGKREVPLGEEGEVIVRGPQVMKGYLRKPEETLHALRHFQGVPWLFTGDIGKMDEDGYLTLVDRAKDMLNVGGYKVFSREVEDKLQRLPSIAHCAIVGVPNPDRPGSELVKLVVELRSAHRDRDPAEVEEEIVDFCDENLSNFKVPHVIQFIDQMPLTAVGKVDKKVLC